MQFTRQRVRDPLHDLIEFRANEFDNVMWSVIQTRPFQRLRRIKQLGFSELVYPGATHTRLSHSIGVFHTARLLINIIEQHLGQTGYRSSNAHVALAASLVHDVGHGPFSHAFESVGRRLDLTMARHETVSDHLIRKGEIGNALSALGSGFAADVAAVIGRGSPGDIYGAVVSSQFDADRLDYMRRDRLMTGTQHGAIDFDWLLSNIEVGSVPIGVDEEPLGNADTFVLGSKAIYAAETYVLGLFQLYPTVYFHKTTRGAERLFSELLFRVIRLVQDGSWSKTGLSESHPLTAFAKAPEELDRVLNLDDTAVWGALAEMTKAEDQIIAFLAIRLRDRHLYKCIDVREEVACQLGNKVDAKIVDEACTVAHDIVMSFAETQNPDTLAKVLVDITEREPYKQLQESRGALNQIMIKRPDGSLVDVAEISQVVAAVKTFKLFRVYVSADDDPTKNVVANAIKEGLNHARKSA